MKTINISAYKIIRMHISICIAKKLLHQPTLYNYLLYIIFIILTKNIKKYLIFLFNLILF